MADIDKARRTFVATAGLGAAAAERGRARHRLDVVLRRIEPEQGRRVFVKGAVLWHGPQPASEGLRRG